MEINIMEDEMTKELAEIHEQVERRYSGIASEKKPSSCCPPDQSCCGTDADGAQFYDGQIIEGLPLEVTNLSLGCGDPVTIAELKHGERVLDLGSGGGIDCFLAAERVGSEGYVIGLDMTDEMLKMANENKERLKLKNVEFRRGNIESMPVEDNSIDVVMSNCVINLSPDKQAVFSEAYRVLKPGGRISISDIVTDGVFPAEMRENTDLWTACISGAIEMDQYIGLMENAGFTQIEVIDKNTSDNLVHKVEGMPRLISARILAIKPETS
jgi:ubiquinone/menaquinone biosynthesis C-methylase UbiE